MNIAIIIAGGTGSRTGQSIPKQFITVNEKPIIIYTLEQFQNCSMIDEIYVAVRREYQAITEDYIKQFGISKVKKMTVAGDSRNKSIANSLEIIKKHRNKDDKILIHHANMPFVERENIEQVLGAVNNDSVVFSSVPQMDYMFKENDCQYTFLDRDNVYICRTPEAMTLDNACKIYGNLLVEEESVPAMKVLDRNDVSKEEFALIHIKSSNINFKITTKDDLIMARAIIKDR